MTNDSIQATTESLSFMNMDVDICYFLLNCCLLNKTDWVELWKLKGIVHLFSWGVEWGTSAASYLLKITISSLSVWRSSAMWRQDTEHRTAVTSTNSNTSFSHQQRHLPFVVMALYMYTTCVKVVRRNTDVVRLREWRPLFKSKDPNIKRSKLTMLRRTSGFKCLTCLRSVKPVCSLIQLPACVWSSCLSGALQW